MFRKLLLPPFFLLASLMATAQAVNAAEHYFELNLGGHPSPDGPNEWVEVSFNFKGHEHSITFPTNQTSLPGAAPRHIFPLDVINMNEAGVLQITQVRFKENATGIIYTIPFFDSPNCRLDVKSKNNYQQPTVSSLHVQTSSCQHLYIRPYSVFND